ncbi:MAG: hypothetical protein M1438_16600 [Deltaproteobacteria bacterium]|nr:hypothetical protein [Deltaproteobacteria bacterium]
MLRTCAERREPAVPIQGATEAGAKEFQADNERRQEELHRIFAPYYLYCPACGSECCREPEIPFSALDDVLYGVKVSPVLDLGKRKQGYLYCFRGSYLGRKLKRFTSADGPWPEQTESAGISVCPALTKGGCSLPWGKRPAVCVFCACPQILAEMGWSDFGRYFWANLKYLSHLTRALGRARRGWAHWF